MAAIPRGINTSVLVKKYSKEISKFIPKFNVSSERFGERFERDGAVNPMIQGTFVDYYIRYYIALQKDIENTDFRAENIVKSDGYLTRFRNGEEITEEEYNIYRMKLAESYKKFKNNDATVKDIFNVSLCHSLFFGEDIRKIKYMKIYLPKTMRESIDSFLDKYVVPREINLNPVFGNEEFGIKGDGDLLVNNRKILDFKVSINSKCGRGDFYQLFIYAMLHFYNTGSRVEELEIYNPLLNETTSVSIRNWNPNELINHFKNRIEPPSNIKRRTFDVDKKPEFTTVIYSLEQLQQIREGRKKFLLFNIEDVIDTDIIRVIDEKYSEYVNVKISLIEKILETDKIFERYNYQEFFPEMSSFEEAFCRISAFSFCLLRVDEIFESHVLPVS